MATVASTQQSLTVWGALGAAGAATAALTWSAWRTAAKPLPRRSYSPASSSDGQSTQLLDSEGDLPVSALAASFRAALQDDALFVYDMLHEDAEAVVREHRSSAGAEIFSGLSTIAGGTGGVIRGAVAGGLRRVAILTDSASAVHILSTVEYLAAKKIPAVVHVAAASAHPDALVEHTDPLAVLHLATALQRHPSTAHAPVIASGDTQSEVEAGARLAKQLAEAAGTPAIHAFGSGAASFVGPSLDKGSTPAFFEYVGHGEASTVFVTLATGSTALAGAITLLARDGHRVGLVRIRVLRPWSSKDLLASLPVSASRLLVVLPTATATATSSTPSPCPPSSATGPRRSTSAAQPRSPLPLSGSPLRPGSTALLVESMSPSKAVHGTSLSVGLKETSSVATSSSSSLGSRVIDLSKRFADNASVASSASTFAKAAAAVETGWDATSPPLMTTTTPPSALLGALVDAAASARAADSGAPLQTSLVLIPYDTVPEYLSSPRGLKLAIDALATAATSPSSKLPWHSLLDAVDALGACSTLRVCSAVEANNTKGSIVRAALRAALPRGSKRVAAVGQTGTVVSEAGATQLTTLTLLAPLLAHTGSFAVEDRAQEVAAAVAVLGTAATTLLLPGSESAATVLDCTAAPSWLDGVSVSQSSQRPRSLLAVMLAEGEDDACAALISAAGSDVRAAAAAAAVALALAPSHSGARGRKLVVLRRGQGVIVDGRPGHAGQLVKLGCEIVGAQELVARAAEAEALALAEEQAMAEPLSSAARRKTLDIGFETPLSARSSSQYGSLMEESKSDDQAPTTPVMPSAFAPSPLARRATRIHRPGRQAASLASLSRVALSRAVRQALSPAHPPHSDETSTTLTCSSASSKPGSVPPPAPARVTAGSLDTPKHMALPFLFPEAFHATTSPRPAEPERLFHATVARKHRLTPEDYSRNVFHIEFDIPHGVKYEMGEALGVYGHNDPRDVDDFLDWYGLCGSDVVTMPRITDMVAAGNLELPSGYGETTTVARAFIQVLDLFGKLSKQFLEQLGAYATDPDERTEIFFLTTPEGKAAFRELLDDTCTIADVLRRFPSAHPPLHDLIALLPPIKPRHYSIASSQAMHPTQVHLLVVTVEWKDASSRHRMGHCTRYLDSLAAGDSVVVSIKPSVMKLPKDPRSPVVMAGLGTGMAPFRAFIEERAMLKRSGVAVGAMVLYFGSRYRSKEYLYGDELEAYEREGVLTRQRLAFSRDQKEKVYIQHLMQQDMAELCEQLHDKGGSFYLCGPTWPEGPVQDAIEGAIASHSGADGAAVVNHMKEAERYILEVY